MFFFKRRKMNTIQEMISRGATIVDVRTREEFIGGHAPGSLNIPLHEVPDRITEFKKMTQPLLLCCQSGNRSGQACGFLGSHGVETFNAGSWMNVNFALSKAH